MADDDRRPAGARLVDAPRERSVDIRRRRVHVNEYVALEEAHAELQRDAGADRLGRRAAVQEEGLFRLRYPSTVVMSDSSAVAREPMWLFMPMAPGTEANAAARSASCCAAVCPVRSAPGPGSPPPTGSIGQWRMRSLPAAVTRRAASVLEGRFGSTATVNGPGRSRNAFSSVRL